MDRLAYDASVACNGDFGPLLGNSVGLVWTGFSGLGFFGILVSLDHLNHSITKPQERTNDVDLRISRQNRLNGVPRKFCVSLESRMCKWNTHGKVV